MQANNALLSFLQGFAPILVYILVDSLFGEIPGLAAGILLGFGERGAAWPPPRARGNGSPSWTRKGEEGTLTGLARDELRRMA